MELHWSIYIGVGLLVTVVSSFLEGFIVFIVVGIILMAVGIGKFIIRRTKAEKRAEDRMKGNMPAQQPKRDTSKYKKCPHCKAWNYPHVARCHHCSKRMR